MSNRKRISNTFVVNTVEDGKSIATVLLSQNSIFYEADSYGYAKKDIEHFYLSYTLVIGDKEINNSNVTIENVVFESSSGSIFFDNKYNIYKDEFEDINWSQIKDGYISFDIDRSKSPHVNGILRVTLSCTYNGIEYTASGECHILPNKQGSAGKMFYYAGVWDDLFEIDNYKFIVTDKQAPFVSYIIPSENNPNEIHFAVFDAPNGEYSLIDMLSNSKLVNFADYTPNTTSSGTYWRIMTNSFDYLITKAIFGDFAKFGSAIISGDWMISQYGTIYDANGTSYAINASQDWYDEGNDITYTFDNAYTLFNPSYPNSNESGEVNFIPNYAVDLKSGKTFQHDAYISGTVEATSGKIGSFRIDGNTIVSTIASDIHNEVLDSLRLYGNGIDFGTSTGHFYVGKEVNQHNGIVDIGFNRFTRAGYAGVALRVGAYDYFHDSAAIDIVRGFVSGLKRYSYKVVNPVNDVNYEYLDLVCNDSTGMFAQIYEPQNTEGYNALYLSIRSGAFIVCGGFNRIVLPDSTDNGFVEDGMFFTFRLLTQTIFMTHVYPGVEQDYINSLGSSSSEQFPANTTVTFTYLDSVWYQS